MRHSMQDLKSLTRDWTHVSYRGGVELTAGPPDDVPDVFTRIVAEDKVRWEHQKPSWAGYWGLKNPPKTLSRKVLGVRGWKDMASALKELITYMKKKRAWEAK